MLTFMFYEETVGINRPESLLIHKTLNSPIKTLRLSALATKWLQDVSVCFWLPNIWIFSLS